MKLFLKHFYTIFIILFIILSVPSNAQQNQKLVQNLTENSDLILEGKVVKQSSRWNSDKSRIYTDVSLEVEEYLKGNKGNKTITVTTLGGEVDGVGELYSHMPTFKNDEEVLLFVKKDKEGDNYKVLDGEDGKMTLNRDKVTGEKIGFSNKKVSTIKNEIKSYLVKQNKQY